MNCTALVSISNIHLNFLILQISFILNVPGRPKDFQRLDKGEIISLHTLLSPIFQNFGSKHWSRLRYPTLVLCQINNIQLGPVDLDLHFYSQEFKEKKEI